MAITKIPSNASKDAFANASAFTNTTTNTPTVKPTSQTNEKRLKEICFQIALHHQQNAKAVAASVLLEFTQLKSHLCHTNSFIEADPMQLLQNRRASKHTDALILIVPCHHSEYNSAKAAHPYPKPLDLSCPKPTNADCHESVLVIAIDKTNTAIGYLSTESSVEEVSINGLTNSQWLIDFCHCYLGVASADNSLDVYDFAIRLWLERLRTLYALKPTLQESCMVGLLPSFLIDRSKRHALMAYFEAPAHNPIDHRTKSAHTTASVQKAKEPGNRSVALAQHVAAAINRNLSWQQIYLDASTHDCDGVAASNQLDFNTVRWLDTASFARWVSKNYDSKSDLLNDLQHICSPQTFRSINAIIKKCLSE